MKRKRKSVTAAELMAQLNADPIFVSRRQDEDEERRNRAAGWHKAEEPLVEELRDAGYQIDSVWDLVNTANPYREALPILLKHISRPYPSAIREGIARALAVPDANFGWEVIAQQYRNERDEGAKGGLAVALGAAADDDVIDEVIALAKNARHGSSRLLLLSALERSSDSRAIATLMELRTDPELGDEVQTILRRLRSKRGQVDAK
jgi:hypothetical protein